MKISDESKAINNLLDLLQKKKIITEEEALEVWKLS